MGLRSVAGCAGWSLMADCHLRHSFAPQSVRRNSTRQNGAVLDFGPDITKSHVFVGGASAPFELWWGSAA